MSPNIADNQDFAVLSVYVHIVITGYTCTIYLLNVQHSRHE